LKTLFLNDSLPLNASPLQEYAMRCLSFAICCAIAAGSFPATVSAGDAPVSAATQECLECHVTYHPGIVADWHKSRHAAVTPAAAMAREGALGAVASTRPSSVVGSR